MDSETMERALQKATDIYAEQLVEIYRCCADSLTADHNLTYEQEKRIEDIQSQITEAVPDWVNRFKEIMDQEFLPQQQTQYKAQRRAFMMKLGAFLR